MSKLNSLDDLFLDELRDLYNAENQITKALPKLVKAASNPRLKSAFEDHLGQTNNQVKRLEQIFQILGQKPGGKVCRAMEGLIAETDELLDEEAAPEVKDAGLIACAQRVEHYEIAGYGSVRTFAQHLGIKEAVTLLQQTLDEEGDTDKKLTKLAESNINTQAHHPAGVR